MEKPTIYNFFQSKAHIYAIMLRIRCLCAVHARYFCDHAKALLKTQRVICVQVRKDWVIVCSARRWYWSWTWRKPLKSRTHHCLLRGKIRGNDSVRRLRRIIAPNPEGHKLGPTDYVHASHASSFPCCDVCHKKSRRQPLKLSDKRN